MKKVELLIPAGNYESLKCAVLNGADAVYFAGKNFGARKYSENFSDEEISEGIKFAHLFGVKVYVTVNTMIYESEINDLRKYLEFLYVSGVDALIMQDLGMIKMCHELLPDLEIHASTQMHNTNSDGFKYLESLGVKRVVLARELSLKEINDIKTPLEKEVFIHGALCVSYSGECLFSSLVGGRSGNRGECAGSCRLPYNLYEDDKKVYTEGKYLLSMKELSSLDNMKEILDSNIDSLKIEGRMKGKTYVSFITRLYRTIIDNYYKGRSIKVSEEDKKKLALIFNREFTKGYLNGELPNNIVNIKSPNHIGIEIGKVIEVKDKIKILLNEDLNQEDGIRFSNGEGMIVNFLYDKNMKLTNNVKKGNICYLDKKYNVSKDEILFKTTDSLLIKEIENYEPRKINITLKVKAKYNELLEVSYDNIKLKGNIVQHSINRPTSSEEIIRSLSKLGNTYFKIDNVIGDIDDNIFISVSELNDIRRRCISLLEEDKSNSGNKNNIVNVKKKEFKVSLTNDISILVRNENHLKYLLTKDVDKIYVTSFSLYQKYKEDERVFYRIPRVSKELIEFKNERLLISNLGSLYKYPKDNYVVSDAYLNTANSFSILKLHMDGVKKVTLSYELNLEDIERMMKDYYGKYKNNPNVEIVIYGKPELMIMKYCPLNKLVNKDNICMVCKNGKKYYLEDRMNEKYRILNDNNHLTYIMHYKNINLLDEVSYLKSLGINNFRIDLLDETNDEIDNILNMIKDKTC